MATFASPTVAKYLDDRIGRITPNVEEKNSDRSTDGAAFVRSITGYSSPKHDPALSASRRGRKHVNGPSWRRLASWPLMEFCLPDQSLNGCRASRKHNCKLRRAVDDRSTRISPSTDRPEWCTRKNNSTVLGNGRALCVPDTWTRAQSRDHTGIRQHEHWLLWAADSPSIAAR